MSTDNDSSNQGDPELGDAGKRAIAAERARADKAERELASANGRLKAYDEAGISDPTATKAEIERLTVENGSLTGDIQSKAKEITRLNVGIDKGLPKSLIARLQGEDEETLSADADSLLEFMPADTKQAPPRPDPSQGPKPTGSASTAQQFADAVGDF
jgi:hypothetical protein